MKIVSDPIVLSKMMQSVGRRYVQYFNCHYKRSGTLWEGRFKSSLVQSEKYLLACYRYIELNPVRALMVQHPLDYRWSSYRYNSGVDQIIWISPHGEYLRLGADKEGRCLAYRYLFKDSIDRETDRWFTDKLNKEFPIGDDRFKTEIEEALGVMYKRGKVGRPRVANCL